MKYILLTALLFLSVFVLAETRIGSRFFKGRWFQRGERKKESDSDTRGGIETYWFNQTLDHFNPSDTRTWLQRYFVNDTFYKPGGPIFLMIGGEGPENPLWMQEGAWITYARELNAMCFSLEHRFYGKSHPTPDLSVENLIFLSSEQALADLASFTQGMSQRYKLEGSKWIAFGGSYPGSLAAWYRLKYPHLVHAAVSTSAPLLAKLNFKEYLGVVRDSINRTNPECLSQIGKAVQSMEMLLKRRTGWWMLQKSFKICGNFRGDNSKDVANFFETMAGNFMDIVQYNEDNRAFEGSATANISIETLCDIMTKDDDDKPTPMTKYAAVNDLMLRTFDKNCTDIQYGKMVKEMQQINWDSSVASGERQWTYQTCTEFGFFQSSDLEDQPFGKEFGVEFSIRQCQDVFGLKFDRDFIQSRIRWTNLNYGEKNIKASRVIFVNGSIDPWHALGLTNGTDMEGGNKVVFIEGTAHCANMYPDSANDLPALRKARSEILDFLKETLEN